MYRDKDKLAINVAKLYYRSDFSQQKIAQELGVSRPSISRLLQYAKDKGYVNIQIVDPVEDMSIMEQRLKDKLHLKDVKIASSTINDEEEIKKYISIAAAPIRMAHHSHLLPTNLGSAAHHARSLIAKVARLSTVESIKMNGRLIKSTTLHYGKDAKSSPFHRTNIPIPPIISIIP